MMSSIAICQSCITHILKPNLVVKNYTVVHKTGLNAILTIYLTLNERFNFVVCCSSNTAMKVHHKLKSNFKECKYESM